MAHQTTRLNVGDGVHMEKPQRTFGNLGHDAVELIELQAKLFMIDTRESARALIYGAVLVLAAAILMLTGATVMAFSLAWLFYDVLEWPRPLAFLAAGGIVLLICGIVGWLGVRKLLRAAKVYRRSGRELSRNLQWFRNAWKRPVHRPTMVPTGNDRM